MGQCCSSPTVVEPDIRAATGSDARHLEDGVSEMVHALATVRASQQAGARHHNRHQPQHSSTPPAGAYHSRAPKQLLRAASPPQQHPQQAQPYGLSPRSYNQLQQLLPTAPLQHVAQGQHGNQHQHQHNKDSAILRSSSSFLGGRTAELQATHSSAGTDQLHSLTLQRLHSASSGGSLTSTPRGAHSQVSKTPADALSPMQVLAVCAAVVQQDAAFQAAGITPLMLASLCLIESGGCPHAKQYREHLGDNAHGICQVLLSTAQWLASSQGFDAHGTSLTVKELENPKTCIYYAAAYLSVLSHHGGSARSEGFVVGAYHAGPKGVDTATACTYLQKYLKAKHWLTEVAKAMAVTVAAAALAVQVPLPAAVADGDSNADGACVAAQGKLLLPVTPDSKTDQACKDQNSSSCGSSQETGSTANKALTTSSSDSATARTATSHKQVMVRRATADLLTALCSSWDDLNQATGKAPPAAAGSGLGAGSILAHMLPSRWGLSSSKQQQAAYDSSSTGAGGPLALVSVNAADLQTAWQRLLCISASVAGLALGHATAAAALAPLPSNEWQVGAASAADAVGDSGTGLAAAAAAPAGPTDSTRRSSSESSRSAVRGLSKSSASAAAGQKSLTGSPAPAAAATAAGAQVVDCMACVMHVVGNGETLQRIAAVCNLNVADLLAANPDVTEADAIHHNDCIAVPVPAVFPRLYVVQPGDTLHSIARAHEVPMGRLLAKNPELTDSSRVQPGWVVALPGLKGDSQVALPAGWLTQAPLARDLQQQQQAYSAALGADGQLQAHMPALWQQQQQQQRDVFQQHAQQGLIATSSFPSYNPRQARSRQHRPWHKHGSGAAEGLGITMSDPGRRQQQEQQLPSVGSGAFLFTVGSGSSLAGTTVASSDSTSSRSVLSTQQSSGKQRSAKKGSSAKGTSSDRAAIAGQSLDVSHSWAVGAEAGVAH